MRYALILFLILILLGCAVEEKAIDKEEVGVVEVPTERETNTTALKELENVEIKEYEGEKLDSATDILDLSIKGPQYIDIDSYRLEVTGFVEDKKEYTYEEVLSRQKYSKVVTLYCVTGWDATVLWEGVRLKDIFDEVKVKPEANTVIFYAEDGYTTSLPLDYILEKNILLADKINNVTLVPENGFPFELVAESKLGYKWIKWVTKIELSDDPDYKGYWEKRGYSNEADLE